MEGYPHGEMSWIYHSSHLHALQLIPSSHGHPKSCCYDEPTVTSLISTKGSWNPVYGCRPCNFYIYKACAELVPYIRHPSHRHHTLTLVPTSPYLPQAGGTTCDACWKPAGGFSYHCTHCSFDLHTLCAFLPPNIEQPTSHPHLLSLSFSSGISTYDCDLCRRKIAATAWFYYCQPCDFQAHTDCIEQARRRCPPSGAADPRRRLNPLNGLTPATWHGQVMGAPGLSSGLEPNRGNSFEELKIAYNSLNDKQGEGMGNSGHADVVEELKNTAADINAVQLAAAQCNLQINTVASVCNLLYNVRI